MIWQQLWLEKVFLAQAPGVNFMNNLLLQLIAIENKQTWKPTRCMKKGMSGKAAVYFAKSVEQTVVKYIHALTHILTSCHKNMNISSTYNNWSPIYMQ